MAEGTKESRIRKKVIRENHLDFLEDLVAKGVPLDKEQKNLLRKHRSNETLPKAPGGKQRIPDVDHSVKSPEQIEADTYIDILSEGDDLAGDEATILDHEAYDKFAQSNVFKYQGGKEITVDDWMPKNKI